MAKAKTDGTAKGKKGKKGTRITGKRLRNIRKAFRKNKQAIQKRFDKFRQDRLTVAELERQVLMLNGQLRDWLVAKDGEDPKATEGGRP